MKLNGKVIQLRRSCLTLRDPSESLSGAINRSDGISSPRLPPSPAVSSGSLWPQQAELQRAFAAGAATITPASKMGLAAQLFSGATKTEYLTAKKAAFLREASSHQVTDPHMEQPSRGWVSGGAAATNLVRRGCHARPCPLRHGGRHRFGQACSSRAALSQALQQPGEQETEARRRPLSVHQPGTRHRGLASPTARVPREGRTGDAKGLHQAPVTARWEKFRLPPGALPGLHVPSVLSMLNAAYSTGN